MGPVLETISKSNEWRGDGRRVVTVHEAADASSSLMPWEDFFKAMHFFAGSGGGKFSPNFQQRHAIFYCMEGI